jgi:hypothetical protein
MSMQGAGNRVDESGGARAEWEEREEPGPSPGESMEEGRRCGFGFVDSLAIRVGVRF